VNQRKRQLSQTHLVSFLLPSLSLTLFVLIQINLAQRGKERFQLHLAYKKELE